MRNVSPEWASIIAREHRVATLARVHSPDGSVADLPITDGSVTLESTTAIRGRCSVTLNGLDWVPTDATDRLAPYGAELELGRGVFHDDGSEEIVPLGWFGVETVDVEDDGLTVVVSGLDRANRMSLAKFEDPILIPGGTVISEAILFLAQAAWPDVPYDPDLPGMTSSTLPAIQAAEGDDRWEVMQGMATAMGMVLFFDGDGLLTLRPYADAGRVAEFVEGDGGLLISASRNWSRTDAHNKWIVTGENTDEDEVYRGVAVDDDPLSPTNYNGDFGKCPDFWSSPYVASDEQAQDAAESRKAQEIGTASNVSFGSVPNPALEPEDTIFVKRERAGINEEHILDSVTIGLAATESMSCTTRERTVA